MSVYQDCLEDVSHFFYEASSVSLADENFPTVHLDGRQVEKLSRHQNIRGMRSARVHVREYKLNIDDSAAQVKAQQAAGF